MVKKEKPKINNLYNRNKFILKYWLGSHLSHPQAHSYLQGYLRMFTFGDLKAINHFYPFNKV